MRIFKWDKFAIRSLVWIFFFILSELLISYCIKDKTQTRSYPRVRTNPVSNITEKGATFNAEIYSLGSEPITEHGFVWGKIPKPTLGDEKILLGSDTNGGPYSAEITSTLSKDVEYTVRSFVQSAEHTVYGIAVTFKSLGSGAPEIIGFEPAKAEWMDTIVIRGKHFSWIKSENIVRLNQTPCTVLSSADTILSILVNKDLSEIKSVLSVEISANRIIHIKDTFNLIVPVINDFYPKEASVLITK